MTVQGAWCTQWSLTLPSNVLYFFLLVNISSLCIRKTKGKIITNLLMVPMFREPIMSTSALTSFTLRMISFFGSPIMEIALQAIWWNQAVSHPLYRQLYTQKVATSLFVPELRSICFQEFMAFDFAFLGHFLNVTACIRVRCQRCVN